MPASTLLPTSIEASSDATLLAAIVQKDERALASVYDKYAPLCYNIAYRITSDGTAADAILQDTFLKVWNKAGFYDGRGSVAGWIVRITRNQALDWLRHERTHVDRIAYSCDDEREKPRWEQPIVDESAEPEHRYAVRESRAILHHALCQLPPEQRSAVELSFIEGLTHTAISELTGVPLGTIKTRVRLGLQKLRTMLTTTGDFQTG